MVSEALLKSINMVCDTQLLSDNTVKHWNDLLLNKVDIELMWVYIGLVSYFLILTSKLPG